MAEYVGVCDPIGGGLCNMYVTDEPVVRCRDCKHYVEGGFCLHFGGIVEADDFCSHARRCSDAE